MNSNRRLSTFCRAFFATTGFAWLLLIATPGQDGLSAAPVPKDDRPPCAECPCAEWYGYKFKPDDDDVYLDFHVTILNVPVRVKSAWGQGGGMIGYCSKNCLPGVPVKEVDFDGMAYQITVKEYAQGSVLCKNGDTLCTVAWREATGSGMVVATRSEDHFLCKPVDTPVPE